MAPCRSPCGGALTTRSGTLLVYTPHLVLVAARWCLFKIYKRPIFFFAMGPPSKSAASDLYASDSASDIIYDGDLAFRRVQGGNGAEAGYQEATGAPVERNSPLGYHVGWTTIIFLNVNQMIGTGIFSTRTSTHSPVLPSVFANCCG